ncbi:polyprenyl synthetase family protein [bacterium SCSIO 12643]|nr:polyprenyl synthetase family protein [bacterium SCSIO 12643]
MQEISAISEKLAEGISKLNLDRDPSGLYEPIKYILSLGGKRIRPLMTLIAAEMFDHTPYNAMPQALAIEVFHNFTLLHDDIMDDAPLRRNKETVHLKWNVNTGILSGDAMLIKAYQLLSATSPIYLSEIFNLFNETALGVCEGQQMDMEFETRDDVKISEYLEMIRLKTAVLLASSLKTGSIIGGANDADANRMYEIGENLGIAFQLQDDILDAFGTQKIGKRIGGDIISNKKTYLLITAQELASGDLKSRLDYWIQAEDFDEAEKVREVLDIFNQLGIQEIAQKEMNKYSDKAMKMLEELEVSKEKKVNINALMNKLLQRDF